MAATPWDAADLDLLKAGLANGDDVATLAARLGRAFNDVAERIALVRAKSPPAGTDEEGEEALAEGDRFDDPAGWVHRQG